MWYFHLADGGKFIDSVDTIALSRRICAGCSMLGSLMLIVGALRINRIGLQRLGSFYRLVLWLAISDFFSAAAAMLGAPSSAELCTIQAFGLSFFELSGILWSTAIANTIHCTFRRVQQLQEREGHLLDVEFALDFCIAELGQGVRAWKPRLMHSAIWCTSLIMAALPMMLNPGYYGRADGWCWIKKMNNDQGYNKQWMSQTLRMSQYYVPLWVAVCYNLIVCGLVAVQLKQMLAKNHVHQRSKPQIWVTEPVAAAADQDAEVPTVTDEIPLQETPKPSTLLLNLLGFPCVLVVSGAAATVMRMEEMFDAEPRYELVIGCGAALALHGLFDTLVYAYPKTVRSQLKELVLCESHANATSEMNQGLIDHVVAHVEVAD